MEFENLGSYESKIFTYCSMMLFLSNSIGFVEFRYAKRKWRQLSHNVMIFLLFRRVNLYAIPCVIVLSLGLETHTKETPVRIITIPIVFTQFGSIQLQIYIFYIEHLFHTRSLD